MCTHVSRLVDLRLQGRSCFGGVRFHSRALLCQRSLKRVLKGVTGRALLEHLGHHPLASLFELRGARRSLGELGFEMCTHARRLVRLRLQLGFETCTHARCLSRLRLQARGGLVGLRLQLGFELRTHARRLISLRLQVRGRLIDLRLQGRGHGRGRCRLRFRGRLCFGSVCYHFYRRTLQCRLQPRYGVCEAFTFRLTLCSLRLHRSDTRLYLRKLLVRPPLL